MRDRGEVEGGEVDSDEQLEHWLRPAMVVCFNAIYYSLKMRALCRIVD